MRRIIMSLTLRIKAFFSNAVFLGIRRHKVEGIKKRINHAKAQEKLPLCKRGDYRTYKVGRAILRSVGRIVCFNKIRRNKKSHILVVIHLFYIKSVGEILEYLKNLQYYNYDLVITYVDECFDQKAFDVISKFKPEIKFIKVSNKGFDIGAFFEVINNTNLDQYDVVMKLQTKGTERISHFWYLNKKCNDSGGLSSGLRNQFFYNRDWFVNLWNGVLGCFSVHKTINQLMNNKRCGLVAAKNLIICDTKDKQKLVKNYLEKHRIECPKNYYYVAGSCFAMKSKALEIIKRKRIDIKEFDKTEYGYFSFAHAMERAICSMVMSEYEYYGNKVDWWRNLKWWRVEKKLRSLSSVIKLSDLEDDKIRNEIEDLIRGKLDLQFMNDVEIIDMEVGKIKYKDLKSGRIKKLIEFNERKVNSTESKSEEMLIVDNNGVIYNDPCLAYKLVREFSSDQKTQVVKIDFVEVNFWAIRPFLSRVN